MEYLTPNGITLYFNGDPIEYTFESNYYENGTYIDLCTQMDDSEIGIKQQRIIKYQNNGNMTITIRWSTNQELIDYINDVKNINNIIE
jgi:hypothetical protein